MNQEELNLAVAEAEAIIGSMPNVVSHTLIGSASFMPVETVADVDFVILLDLEKPLSPFDSAVAYKHSWALGNNWEECSDYDTNSGSWAAIRKGSLNFMLTDSREFFHNFLIATEVCKALFLQSKLQRILVCRIIRDKMTAEVALKSLEALDL